MFPSNFFQKYIFICAFLCWGIFIQSVKAQIVVDSSYTVQQLVSDVLLGSGIQVSNITYNGQSAAIGHFDGTNSNLGIDSGIVVTSGNISGIPGPNNSGSTSTMWGGPGDNDLDNLTTSATEDASVLEFDFIPSTTQVKFKYIFGSEEYMEYVNSSYNDVFGFFISGPGITGTQNMALIPNTTTPVTINNVNNNKNSVYYFDNENPTGKTVQFDGFTTVLEAKMDVIPCETYHIKIAVADAGDDALDSGVFLEAGSFASGVSAAYIISEAADDSSMYEGCSESQLIFTRSGVLDSAQVVQLTIDGTAQNGIDYSLIPDSIVFPSGEDTITLTISTFIDSNVEPTESIIINIINKLCSDSVAFSVDLNIIDAPILSVVAMPDTNICSGDSILLSADINGATNNKYSIRWNNYALNDSMIYAKGGNYMVYVTDSCGRSDSDMVAISSLVFVSSFLYDYQTDTVVNFHSTSADSVLFWDFGDNSITSTEKNPIHTYSDSGTYAVSLVVLNSMGCIDTIIEYVHVEIKDPFNFFIPNTFTPDGDGLNDYFIARGEFIKTFEMRIYDRWGSDIYTTTDIAKPWDGKTIQGNEAVEDAYQYLITVINTSQQAFTYRGLVSLIR